MLKDIHLQQAAGITEMIQGVKENLMNQQTLKHKGGDDGGLEIFNKIGGGGFGEVFKGKYREVQCTATATPCGTSACWVEVAFMPKIIRR